eukprot:TRINITY_DN7199_c0_g1_i1.p1 TRINITY_DN7199_c0_g1~~TRINITY_DN7199_c0_g1_i1.p1  ORF type:complete len:546 (+),score=144.53 TRINITY_DN7199_c0_g1_i1:30-1640(+)
MCSAKKLKLFDKAEELFNKLLESDDELIDWDYNVMIDVYVKTNKIKQARRLLEQMKSMGLELKVFSYGPLIHRCIATNRFDEALELYDEMRDFGIIPNAQFFNGIAKACAEHGAADRVEKLLAEMVQLKFEVEASTTEAVLAGKIKITRKIVQNLSQLDIHITARQLDFLVDLCVRNGGEVLASKLVENAKTLHDFQLLSGTYHTLISALAMKGKIPEARNLFNEAVTQGVQISSGVRKKLIGFEKKYEEKLKQQTASLPPLTPKDAKQLELPNEDVESKSQPMTPSAPKETVDKDVQGLVDTLEISLAKAKSAFEEVFERYVKVGMYRTVERIFSKILSVEKEMNRASYDHLLEAYCKSMAISDAERILNRMGDSEFEPSLQSYRAMIHSYCLAGMVERAVHLVRSIEVAGKVSLDISDYNLLLKEYCKRGAVHEIIAIISQLKHICLVPNYVTVKMILEMCCARGYASEAILVLKMVHSIGFPMDYELCNLVIQSFPDNPWPVFAAAPSSAQLFSSKLTRQDPEGECKFWGPFQ